MAKVTGVKSTTANLTSERIISVYWTRGRCEKMCEPVKSQEGLPTVYTCAIQ